MTSHLAPIKRARRQAAAFAVFSIAFALLPATNASAEGETYPWGFLRTATLWQGDSFIRPLNGSSALPPGFGAAGAFEVQGLFAPFFTVALNASYRWQERGGVTQAFPGAGLAAGWRFHVAAPAALIPFAGLGFEAAPEASFFRPTLVAAAGCNLALRLRGENFINLAPSVSVPLMNPEETKFSLALGLRREYRWLVPVPPVGAAIAAAPPLFSPDGDGNADTVAIAIDARHPGSAQRWTVEITDGNGKPIRGFSGRGRLPRGVTWNGMTSEDSLPEPGTDYRITLETVDKAGRRESAYAEATCDILLVAEGAGYKIRVPAIRFSSNSFTLSKAESEELYEANRDILQRIAALFLRFPDYSLIIEGHANSVFRNDPTRFEREQRETLLPLSEKRAETVKRALILAGIEEDRMKIAGKGGLEPLTEADDSEGVAKNRRVEFILIRDR